MNILLNSNIEIHKLTGNNGSSGQFSFLNSNIEIHKSVLAIADKYSVDFFKF